MIAVALKGLAARKVRAVLTAFAVVIGVAMVSGTFILTDTTESAGLAVDNTSTATTDAAIFQKEIVKGSAGGSGATVPASLLAKVRALPGVGAATGDVMPLGETNVADIIGRDGKPVATQSVGRGFDPAATQMSPVKAGSYGPLELAAGRWPKGAHQVVIDRHTAATQHYAIGDPIVISTLGRRRTFALAGTVSYVGEELPPRPSFAGWDIKTAQAVLDRPDRLDAISIDAKPGVSGGELARRLKPLLPADLQLKTMSTSLKEAEGDWKHTMSTIRTFLLVFGLIALLVGAFVIFNTLSITVAQRTRELATLRTLGASRKQVMRSVVVEGLVLGLVASAVGLVAGYGLAKGMSVVVDGLGLDLPDGPTVLASRTILVSMALGVGVTLLASVVPARRATRVPPIAAVREGATLPPTRLSGLARHVLRPIVPLARLVGWPARRTGGTAGDLASANAVRSPGRTAATAGALMIGLALVTVVAVLGASVNSATRSAISDQVQADYVIDSQSGIPLRAAGGDALAALPGVTAASHVRSDTAIVAGDETAISGIDPATIAHFYRFTWSAGSERELGTNGAVVTQRYADGHHVAIGDELALRSPSGTQRTVVVRGIYEPPPATQLLDDISIGVQAFDAAFRTPRNSFTFLDAEPGAAAAIESAAKNLGDARFHTGADYPKDVTKDLGTLLAMLYALLGLSVVVSLFGMANTMVLSVFERTREIGMLRAIGMTRRQVRRMIRHESVITALMGASVGLAFGLVVAAAVATAVPDATTLTLPWLTLAALTAAAVLAGVTAAILPARRASRLDVLNALHYE